MAGWLFKTEPSTYSFARLMREKRTTWDGITNALALIHLRQVKRGDRILIYHTGDEKAVIGVARALADATQEKLAAVEIAPEAPLASPVILEKIKADPKFAGFGLVTNSRLSVMPVAENLWEEILRMGA